MFIKPDKPYETEINRMKAMEKKKRENIKSKLQDEKEKKQRQIEKRGLEQIQDLF
ncbi:hypothetical protein LCGC14_1940430 [marine sediment metagenome]|uniref:Uncharacterized protein n=1 Tax=marine sediment metagenome TaxID=412755 RepID=A0A0F9FKE7_9ZZZZ